MSTEDTVLKTEARTSVGSLASRKSRREGRIPVNIFGHGKPNYSATIDAHDLELALATTAQVFSLDVEGAVESCLVKEVQYDTFGQYVLHVDMSRIDLTEDVDVTVALAFQGNAVGEAEGGMQVIHHPALAVHCPAGSIPESIVVDIEALEIGQIIHAGEIELPKGVKLDKAHMSEDEPVFGIAAPKKVVEEETSAEGEEGDADGEPKAEGDKGDAGDKGDK